MPKRECYKNGNMEGECKQIGYAKVLKEKNTAMSILL